jgi:hypothetical protein
MASEYVDSRLSIGFHYTTEPLFCTGEGMAPRDQLIHQPHHLPLSTHPLNVEWVIRLKLHPKNIDNRG